MLGQNRLVYFLTAISFSSVNSLNVTYSFVKRFIQTDFAMTSTQIGLADALKFLGNIIGLVIYISFGSVSKNRIPHIYSLSIALNALFMGFIPFLSVLGCNGKWIVFVFNFFGGISKAPSWPLLLQLVKDTIFRLDPPQHEDKNLQHEQQTSKRPNEKQIGNRFILWTSFTLMGNIFGLVVCQILVYKVNLSWNYCLLIPVCSILIFAFFMSIYSWENVCIVHPKGQIAQQEKQPQTVPKTPQMIIKCLRLLFLTKNCTFIWSLVLLLSIHSILMMFLPLFLFKIGYHEYEGYILAWYNVWVILGTVGFTCIKFDSIFKYQFLIMPKNQPEMALQQESKDYDLHETTRIQQQISPTSSLEVINFLSLFLLLVACIILITLPCPYDCGQVNINGQINPEDFNHNYKVVWYFVVLGFVGLFLGGPLNKYESYELLQVLKQYEQVLKDKGKLQRPKLEKKPNSQPKIKTGFKTFIGIIQLASYLTVMFFLILTGHIIQTQILGFFYLSSILAGFLLILDIIKLGQRQLSN